MSARTRLYSTLTLLLAVILPSIALLVGSKDLARIVFVVVLLAGYGTIAMVSRRKRQE